MVQSTATTVDAYLAELPDARREVVTAVRALVNAHLPPGFEETMAWGMLSWQVPLARYPDTYNGQPLGIVGLAAQKRHYALYLMCAYGDPARDATLREAYRKAGRTLDMGKGCLRFTSLDALLPEAVADILASTTVEDFIARYEASRARTAEAGARVKRSGGPARKAPSQGTP